MENLWLSVVRSGMRAPDKFTGLTPLVVLADELIE